MASFIINQISSKVFNESSPNELDTQDKPYNQYQLLKGNKWLQNISHQPSTKYQISDNLSTNNHKVVNKLKRRSYQLDNLFQIFGFELGLNSLLGLIPFVGSFINLFNSILIYSLVFKLDHPIPFLLHLRMLINLIVEFVSNFVPILGQIFNANYKASTRNTHLIVNYLNSTSDANYQNLLKYVNRDNINNKNNAIFNKHSSSPIPSTYHQLTKDDDFSLSETDNDSNLSYTNMASSTGNDLQDKLIKHQRTLSNHVYESDASVSGFFK